MKLFSKFRLSWDLNRWILVAALAIQAGLLAYGAWAHSPTYDELGHLPAGLAIWQQGRFDLYAVNPPLVRMVAGAPLAFLETGIKWPTEQHPYLRQEMDIGTELVDKHRERSLWFFTVARWACIPFSLLGAYICWRWARELYGDVAGFLALAFWCLEPNILGHGQLITADAGATAFGVAAFFGFRQWLKKPTWRGALLCGLLFGLLQLTKTTWIILFLLWPVLWALWRFSDLVQQNWKGRRKEASQMLVILTLGVYVINHFYGFQGTFQSLGEYPFMSKTLRGADEHLVGNRFSGSWLEDFPVPLPKYYVMGIDVQKFDFEIQRKSYLRGEWRNGGWWYYYLYALGVKVPLGLLFLLSFAVFLSLCGKRCSAGWKEELLLLAPPAVVLILVSSQTDMTQHMRYVLPIFPFLLIWVSKVGQACSSGSWLPWLNRSIVGTLAFWFVSSSLLCYPHTLSYFNELAGGPKNGRFHLVDSNLDWGQDLLFLKKWLKVHPEARPLTLLYFGSVNPAAIGIDYTLGPVAASLSPKEKEKPAIQGVSPPAGWYAISVGVLQGMPEFPTDAQGRRSIFGAQRAFFQNLQPVAWAGYSICIYQVTGKEQGKE